MSADMKRKLARAMAVLLVALGAGQFLQSVTGFGSKPRVAQSETVAKAKDVKPLTGEVAPAAPKAALPETLATATPRLPDAPAVPQPSPVLAAKADPTQVAPDVPSAPVVPAAPLANADVPPVAPAPTPQVTPLVAEAKADACAMTLDLGNTTNAMVAVTLLAPCAPNQRIVLKHAGLAVTGKTTATGAYFADIPALTPAAQIEVVFADGTKAAASIDVPELSELRRFAVQWQADDAFQIHAFEDDTGYGGPGDVWAGATHKPAPGLPAKGGFLTLLGDDSTELPLLAEVYTYPADPLLKPVVVVEAPVTAQSCGREILAETLISIGGTVNVSDLSAAMPGCDAVGDYLVLKNLVADQMVASSN